jgi:hypothetical protein
MRGKQDARPGLAEVGRSDPVGVLGWPLHQLDPVAIGVSKPRCPRAVGSSGLLLWLRLQAPSRQHLSCGGEIVYLDDEVAKPGANRHRSAGRPVNQLKRDDLLARELEHRQARPVADADPPDLLVTECEIEVQRDGQVSDPIRSVERFHPPDCRAR